MTKTDESETSFRVDRARLIWLAVRRALLALIAGVDAVFGVETKNVTFIVSEVGNSNRN